MLGLCDGDGVLSDLKEFIHLDRRNEQQLAEQENAWTL
jgi:hypothetical protein